MQKYISPCSYNCPVNTDVPGYIDSIINGNYERAYYLISARNPFPSVCAWVCPHPCEDGCRRSDVDEALNIRGLKRFAVEQASGGEAKEKNYISWNGRSGDIPGGDVAIIGAGPSGLTAARELLNRGFSVTVLERNDEPGGHFYSSLPLYRLPREVVRKDVANIIKHGAKVVCGVEVGKDITMEQLGDEFKAIIVAAGLQESRMLPIPGTENNPLVLPALSFLKKSNFGQPVTLGNNVVVIGGGNVAMDVARTALRQGAGTVSLTCLESFEEMPANSWEVEEAREEGVVMYPSWGPKEVVVDENGNISGLKVNKVTSVFDENGKFNPQFDNNVVEVISGDCVIVAIGQAPSLDFAKGYLDIDERGNLKVDRENLITSVEGVFACGEVAKGPGPAISAIASGRQVAEEVVRYLSSTADSFVEGEEDEIVLSKLPDRLMNKITLLKRKHQEQVEPKERKGNFETFEFGLNKFDAVQEASRCLRCGLGADVDTKKCIACLTCQRVCPFGVPAIESKAKISPDTCQACGICASACPARAITIKGLSLDSADDNEKVVKVYACRRATDESLFEEFGKEGFQLGANDINILPCLGVINADWVLKDFEKGYYGIAVIPCADQCTIEGAAGYRDVEFNRARTICDQIGIPGERLVKLPSNSDLPAGLAEFYRQVVKLGSPWED